MSIDRFAACDRGAAASEFVLALPMMLILMFISMEAGNYFWNEQKLVQAVRDGARYASRLNQTDICSTSFKDSNADKQIRAVIRTGKPDGSGTQRLPIWDEGKVSVVPHCEVFKSTGLYSGLGKAGAIVNVSVEGMPYRSILGTLGFAKNSVALAASNNAPVIGL